MNIFKKCRVRTAAATAGSSASASTAKSARASCHFDQAKTPGLARELPMTHSGVALDGKEQLGRRPMV
jgi:hypothetical protein